MSLQAGNANFKVVLSASHTADAPSGNHVKFFCEGFTDNLANLIKPKPTVGMSIYVPVSKYNVEVTLKNCIITKQGLATATAEYNAVRHFLYQNSISRSASVMYLFLYCEAESDARVYLDWTPAGAQTYRLPCAFDGMSGEMNKGAMYTIGSLKLLKAG
jgi:hypothetical protein